jgi:RNA polymerase sigma-70 factor (ECF subfamily)
MIMVHAENGPFGSPEEFELFYQKTSRRLWAYLYRLCGNSALADDLLQETYLRLLNVPALKAEESLRKAYLYKIAANLVTDHWRQSRREQSRITVSSDAEEEERELEIPTEYTPDRKFIQKQDFQRVFQTLRPLEQSLLWLAYVEGNEHKEMAEALGCKEKSIRVMLFRARQKMAELLKKRGLAPEVMA